MNLYILRHGIAVEPGTPGYAKDADRPLTLKGRRKLRKIAKAMKALDLDFDLVLSSPALRARQTAEVITHTLQCPSRLEFADVLAPGIAAKQCARFLVGLRTSGSRRQRRGADSSRKPAALNDILIVGHEPQLSELISLLISSQTHAAVLLKKGGLCKLSAESLKAGRCAELEWLLTPGLMKGMS